MHGPDTVNLLDQDKWTPLLRAACNGHAAVVEILLKLKATLVTVSAFAVAPCCQHSAARMVLGGF